MKSMSEKIDQLRHQLCKDAEYEESKSNDKCRREWVDPAVWSQYTGKVGRQICDSFTDIELLDILRRSAKELGHIPSQREVFCVYRMYIRRRFTNWPTALRAAGLKAPRSAPQGTRGKTQE